MSEGVGPALGSSLQPGVEVGQGPGVGIGCDEGARGFRAVKQGTQHPGFPGEWVRGAPGPVCAGKRERSRLELWGPGRVRLSPGLAPGQTQV